MKKLLYSILGERDFTYDLYQEALTHTTYANENKSKHLKSNERLEFLGDAVLELIVSQFLFKKFPSYPEGKLTTIRAQLVQEASLAFLARQLKLNKLIQLGRGEIMTGGNERDSILADTYESFLGAIYLDLGIEAAIAFVEKTMFEQFDYLIENVNKDYKTQLQELLQQNGQIIIRYEVMEQTGPAHDMTFTVGLYIEDELISKGSGKNKKMAEMSAAKNAFPLFNKRGIKIQ